jgi:cyclic pyranopterin phosphate synthase
MHGVRPDGMSRLTHIDESGAARMVDVSDKAPSKREAVARGFVRMNPGTVGLIRSAQIAKGDVLAVARVAGIQAAKRTCELIPLCHPIPLSHVTVDFEFGDGEIEIRAVARTTAVTGVEMEALTAVAVAALTIYDMSKAADKSMRLEGIELLSKSKQPA